MKAFLVAMFFMALVAVVLLSMAGNIGKLLDIRRYEAQAQYAQAQASLLDEQAELVYAKTLQAMAARQNSGTMVLYGVIAFLFLLTIGAVVVALVAVYDARKARQMAYLYQLSAGNAQQLQPGQYLQQTPIPVQVGYPQGAQR